MSESNVVKRIMMDLSAMGCRLFRNNVGEVWTGKYRRINKDQAVMCEEGDVIIKHARRFHGGLVVGSGDIIGWTPTLITPDMVGLTLAIFTDIEGKKDEKTAISSAKSRSAHEQSQQRFAEAVIKGGGFAGFAGSTEQAQEIINPSRLTEPRCP
ncbi:MAG: hypothetical protein COB09_19040 [Thalassobium sp.]|nr:MAG: hypothetical protein COB09_19040 [Thalassobium sp.]